MGPGFRRDDSFTTAEAKALFERARKIAGSYKPVGAW
jgi:hypothetical protein